ncbi:hypothetical protein ACQEWB_16440 [Streptomyces sp. CA-249302]|uniref:hypothetical protein n=1 Tax=Streptomyces sp. CA-249302 TaxID=3240058 RepID=UPI003D8C8956
MPRQEVGIPDGMPHRPSAGTLDPCLDEQIPGRFALDGPVLSLQQRDDRIDFTRTTGNSDPHEHATIARTYDRYPRLGQDPSPR